MCTISSIVLLLTFLYRPPVVGSLFFQSPSMIYISQQQLVNITQILSDGATRQDRCLNWCLTSFSFSSCLLFYCSEWRDEWQCSLFLLLWFLRRDFLSIWIEKDFWRWQDLNPQTCDLIHDELDHMTMVSCLCHIILSLY